MGRRPGLRTDGSLDPGFQNRPPGRDRHGVAAAETAVCLPVIVLLVFGSIEASSQIFLKQSLNVAAYEAVRTATAAGGDNADANVRGRAILDSRGVSGATVRFPNGDVSGVGRGDLFAVEVSAPTASNSPLLGQFLPDRVLTARVVMTRQ